MYGELFFLVITDSFESLCKRACSQVPWKDFLKEFLGFRLSFLAPLQPGGSLAHIIIFMGLCGCTAIFAQIVTGLFVGLKAGN